MDCAVTYNRVMENRENFLGDDFIAAVIEAGNRARLETLQAGVPVFYRELKVDIMEQPDGKKFEIRYIPGAPRDQSFEIVRELQEAV